MLLYISILILIFPVSLQCAKIFCVFHTASFSHQIVFQSISKALSLRGHEVTVLTPNPLKDPSLINLTEIDLSYMYNEAENVKPQIAKSMTHWDVLNMLSTLLENNLKNIFGNEQVLAVIRDNSQKFDIVLAEEIAPVTYAFAAKFKCPFIGVASVTALQSGFEAIGAPTHPLLYPDIFTTFSKDMTFFERVEAVIYDQWQRYIYHYKMYPTINRYVKYYFGNDMPNVEDIAKNISMLFLNTNPILYGARPFGPNVIQMGRMHFHPKRPLPKDIKNFLNNSTRGVIYLNFGTNVKSKYLDEDKIRLIKQAFSKLPYDILWKFEDEELQGKPSNVKISKWLPQQDLLAHPNIKLFITQGGLQSFEEAVVNGVPLLAIPFIGDQYTNAKRIEKLGIGLQLRYSTLTKDIFKDSILEILHNPQYKKKAIEIGALLLDEPNTGLERAIWWTEYVIRHKGAPYFQSPSVNMPWYQFLLLDVFGFLFAILLFLIYVFHKIFKFLINRLKPLKKGKAKAL